MASLDMARMTLQNPALAANIAQATVATSQMGSNAAQAANSGAQAVRDSWQSLATSCFRPLVLDDIEVGDTAAEGLEATILRFRLCVYSGENLAKERSYPVVTIGVGSDQEKRLIGPESSETEHPLWEFTLDEEIKIMGQSLRVDVRIFGKRIRPLNDKLLGMVSIRLPTQAMDAPKKQELRLHSSVSSFWPFQSFGMSSTGSIITVWQVCKPNAYSLDLCRVAEMDGEDLEVVSHTVMLKVLKLRLKQPLPQQKVQVVCKLVCLDGRARSLTRPSPYVLTMPEGESGRVRGRPLDEEDLLQCTEATWHHGDSIGAALEPFVLHESKVTLMSWFLEISVYGTRDDLSSGLAPTSARQRPRFAARGLSADLVHTKPSHHSGKRSSAGSHRSGGGQSPREKNGGSSSSSPTTPSAAAAAAAAASTNSEGSKGGAKGGVGLHEEELEGPSADTTSSGGGAVSSSSSRRPIPSFFGSTFSKKTTIRSRQTALMQSMAHFLPRTDEDRVAPALIGSWREPLSDLMQSIDEGSQALLFQADLGIRVGSVHLELDLFTEQPHRSLLSLVAEDITANENLHQQMAALPMRHGMAPESKWSDRLRYCCSVYVDGLPVTRPIHPYVRIVIGNTSAMSDVFSEARFNDIIFSQPVMIDTTRFYRKATVELYHCKDPTGAARAPENDELLGTQTVYDVSLDKECWLHLYGGAVDAPNQDFAMNMVKGAQRPASTYQGTVCLVMGSKRSAKSDFTMRVLNRRTQQRLVVRLYKGLYMERYRNQKVTVLVQLAGCRLPDEVEGARLLKEQQQQDAGAGAGACNSKSSSAGSRARSAFVAHGTASTMPNIHFAPPPAADPAHWNPNLLAFSGEVDDAGVMRFRDPTTGAEVGGSKDGSCCWVELSTLKDFPLSVPPNVTHAYLYVVAKGQEHEPPAVFGRIRLALVPPGQPGWRPSRWRRLRLDRSVCDDRKESSFFYNNLEGFIMGSAYLVDATTPRLSFQSSGSHCSDMSLAPLPLEALPRLLPPAVSTGWGCSIQNPCTESRRPLQRVGSPGEPTEVRRELVAGRHMQTIYCYVDVLAARDLPAMDEDGLMDPAYRIKIQDKVLTQTDGMHKTTSPTFMHRIVVPFQIEAARVSTGQDGKLLVATTTPLPPVIISLLDHDASQSVFENETYEEVGSVVVKHEPAPGRHGQWIYKMMDYDEATAMPESDTVADEYTTTKRKLDLNHMHKAQWFSLDTPGRAVFDSAVGGVVQSWNRRPRLLVAVGFSAQLAEDPKLFGAPIDLTENSSGSAYLIECAEKACYEIDIDLLGLRNLPPQLSHPVLSISSFWNGPRVSFDVASGRDFTFQQGFQSPEVMRGLAGKMAPLLKLYDPKSATRDEEIAAGGDLVSFDELNGCRVRAPVYRVPVIPYLQKRSLKAGKWSVKPLQTSVVGEAVPPSSHEFNLFYSSSRACLDGTEVIVQSDGKEELIPITEGRISGHSVEWKSQTKRWAGTMSEHGDSIKDLICTVGSRESGGVVYEAHWLEAGHADPFVLLPAVTFELTNALTRVVYLTLTVGLNRLLLASGGPQVLNWTDLSLEEMKHLPLHLKEWADSGSERKSLAVSTARHSQPRSISGTSLHHRNLPIKPLTGCKVMEDAYQTFVDVFAAETGFMTFDTDFRMGRPLYDQCLFYVEGNHLDPLDSEPKVNDDAKPQYFNPADWMCRGFEGPFDARVWPSFHCRSIDAQVEALRETLSPDRNILHQVQSGSGLRQSQKQMKDALKKVSELINPPTPMPRYTAPLGPKDLYGHVRSAVSKKDFASLTTHDLKERMAKMGWRTTSHLVAPEQEKINPDQVFGEDLSANTHTFMRPVGHIINTMDRDSKILCRLQMGLPIHALEELKKRLSSALQLEAADESAKALLDEDRRWKHAGSKTVNYLVVKFRLNGMVIWTAPEDNPYFSRPGTPLFAVRLADHPDVVVPVYLPSLDIRRRAETVWLPVKTLRTRFKTLLMRIEKQAAVDTKRSAQKRWSKAKAFHQQNQECPSGLETDYDPEEEHDKNPSAKLDTHDAFEPDGYSRPIAVARHAFVCRIRHRMGGVAFDRPQTKNWFRTALEDAFPELALLNADRDDVMEHSTYVTSRFMNLRRQMTTGIERTAGATIKGHIKVKRVLDPEEVQSQGLKLSLDSHLPLCTAPEHVDNSLASVENLWISETVFVRVYVMSAHKVDVGSLGLAGNFSFKPYVSVSLGSDVQSGKVTESMSANQQTINIYQKFVFQCTFPGTSILNIDLKTQGLMQDSTVGSVRLDLEDRLLVLKRREFREASNEAFLRRRIAPKSCRRWKKDREFENGEQGWIEPVDPDEDPLYGVPLQPLRGLPEPSPIELASLVRAEEESSGEGRAGLLRYLIDITPVGTFLPEDPEIYTNEEFEVRMVIYSVDNINVFRDFGERNDVYIKAAFRSQDYDRNVSSKQRVTDTHKYARHTASFNWNMSFTCTAPAAECAVELTLMDADKFGDNDLIYYPKYYSLDHHLWFAYKEYRQNKRALATLTDTIVFDRWPRVEGVPSQGTCCSCWQRMRRKLATDTKMFATMKIGISIIPKSLASKEPFEEGQFAQPRDRFSYVNALENPNATAKMILGPKRWFRLALALGIVGCIFGLLILSMLAFFLVQIKRS